MPSDSSDVDNALIAKLGADTALLGLMTNGVYWDDAPQGSTKFVRVSLIDDYDEPMFNARAFEDAIYSVEAIALASAGVDVKAAAFRIDALLDWGTLTVPGYSLMTMRRVGRLRKTEVDVLDTSIRWQRRGGRYRVMVSPS